MYQYIDFTLESTNPVNVKVINRYDFTSTDKFDLVYEFLDNGKVIKTGLLNCPPISPGKSQIVSIDLPEELNSKEDEIILNVYAKLKKPTLWAETGFTVAKEQFVIKTVQAQKIERLQYNSNS